ncbi:MAG: glycosyltransferase family 9 protein [Bacteroidaceae bacterium]|nr:glycosyltransferase family 9 protein [Bacteroidaceae bacterium]
MKRMLIMRFSAMGDVAMTVPVVYAVATQNPELRITMMTRTRLTPLFEWMPSNVTVMGVDLEQHEGLKGLTNLYLDLRKHHFDTVVDLHDVLRTIYLRICFRVNGTHVVTVDKGREGKKELIGNALTHEELKPMAERYADVFRNLGLRADLSKKMNINLRNECFAPVRHLAGEKQEGEKWVGVAPFAAHIQKVYPLEKMQQVVHLLADKGHKVFLFGAGEMETKVLSSWVETYRKTEGSSKQSRGEVCCTCGKLGGLKNEMLLMSLLDLMISMDSANMHIASMLDVPVLSIWGATHPKAGFVGYGQKEDSMVQVDLPCRPCSVYGNKACLFGDIRCMNIAPETIVNKAEKMLL